MNISHLFNSIVSAYRLTESKDFLGSPVSTFTLYLSSVRCRIQQRTGYEPVEGGRRYSKIAYVMYCDFDTDLDLKDVVLYDGETFSIVDIDEEGNRNAYKLFTLEKIDANICIPCVQMTEDTITLTGDDYAESNCYGIWSDDTYTYATITEEEELRAYTFDGATLTTVASISIADSGSLWEIWGDGNYIYVGCTDAVKAFTFNGTTFTEVGSKTVSSHKSVMGDGEYIYFASTTDGTLYAYTFDETNDFVEVGSTQEGFTFVYDIFCKDGYIYVSATSDGLIAFTFDGYNFKKVASIDDSGGDIRGVTADDNYVYAGGEEGLTAYSFDGEAFTKIDQYNEAKPTAPFTTIRCYRLSADCGTIFYNGDSGATSTADIKGIGMFRFDGETLTLLDTIDDEQIYTSHYDGTHLYGGNRWNATWGGLNAYSLS